MKWRFPRKADRRVTASASPISPPGATPGSVAPSGDPAPSGNEAPPREFPTPGPPEPGSDGRGPSWEPLLRHPDLTGHPVATEVGLVIGWLALSALLILYLSSDRFRQGTPSTTFGWLFAVVSGVMVAVVLAFGRVARHRIEEGLRDANEALRSVELVTDPALSFHPLDVLLEELLRRVLYVVRGDVATIFLMSEDGRELAVRSSRGLEELVAAKLRVPVGEGVIGGVADRARAVIVNDVRSHAKALPQIRERVASLVAAPLLLGSTVTGVIQVGTRAPHRFRDRDVRLLQIVADRTAASIERARLDEAARRSRLGAEHARRHLALLARAGEVLSTALESFDDALARLVDVVVPSFADWFAIDLVDAEGRPLRVAAGSQGERFAAADGPIAHRHPHGDQMVRRVMVTGRPEVVMPTSRMGAAHGGQPAAPGAYADAAPASGIESMLVVPIRVRGLGFGALSFTTGNARRGYRRSDLETAQDLADRISVAVQRVMLWRESREAERTATRHAEQLRRLMEAAFAVNAALEESEVVRVLADHARQVLGARYASVLLPLTGGAEIESQTPEDAPERVTQVAISASRHLGYARRLMRSIDSGDLHAVGAQASPADDTWPWLGIVLLGGEGGRPRSLVVVDDATRDFSAEDESALELLAQMGSVALENARLYQAVQSNEQRLRAVVESSPLAIAELDLEGTALSWNRAAAVLFGWDDVAVGSQQVPEVVDDAEAVLPWLWARARQGEASVGAEVSARRADGEPLELSVSTAPLRDRLGTVTGILAVIADVTERKRMLDQFTQAERLAAMARLAGGVAHDFNNLLTVILGSSEILQRQLPEDEAALQEVAAIRRAGERAAMLTGELLALGHGGVSRAIVVVLDEVVSSFVPMLERIVGDNVVLDVVHDGLGGRVKVDPAEIERVVLNLVLNARDAMSQTGGRITVETQLRTGQGPEAPAQVVLSVRDNGHGMDAHTAAHCFEPFFTTKGRVEGTGLGLAAVQSLVTQAGGHITLDTAPGAGTTFTVWLPAVAGDVALAPLAEDVEPVGGEELILVVEDEDELRRLAAEELSRWGYMVLTASDGAEALLVAEALDRRLDLLVTDVVMPGMNGVDVAAELTTRMPWLPVLFVSGHLGESSAEHLSLGEDADLLAKPYTPGQLVRRVRQVLDLADTDGSVSPAERAERRA